MLCQFTFQNFKSYKSETTLDFQATALPEFKDTLITEAPASDLLPVSVVYGPNGGGKSNLLQALSCLIFTVVNPVKELGKNRQDLILQQEVASFPFLFDETSRYEPTEFRIFFRIDKNEYCYYLSLKKDEVIFESLYRKAITGKKLLKFLNGIQMRFLLDTQLPEKVLTPMLTLKCRIFLSWLSIMIFPSSLKS